MKKIIILIFLLILVGCSTIKSNISESNNQTTPTETMTTLPTDVTSTETMTTLPTDITSTETMTTLPTDITSTETITTLPTDVTTTETITTLPTDVTTTTITTTEATILIINLSVNFEQYTCSIIEDIGYYTVNMTTDANREYITFTITITSISFDSISLIINNDIIDQSKYTQVANIITYKVADPNWTAIY